ncbi:MAG: hypothetical protein ACREJC_11310, partial [Tepidisphaeraceae bacterium]
AYVLAAIQADPAKRTVLVQAMLENEDWEQRLLGLMVLPALAPEQRKEMASKVASNDSESVVRKYAACVVEITDAFPTAEPAPQEGTDATATPAPPP